MTVEAILSILGLLGIGGILGAYFQYKFNNQSLVDKELHTFKYTRYKAIVIQMYTLLNPERDLSKFNEFREDIHSVEELKREINLELMNSVLYASDEVIRALNSFSDEQSTSNFLIAVKAMRSDLWGKRTSIKTEDFQEVIEDI